jgi:iron complex outermembrane recepter protein
MPTKRSAISAAVAACLTCTYGATVAAQQPPAVAPKVEKIEVTGSNIKRIDAETNVPIQVITADEIRRSGKTTVTDLLRELPINAAGGLTELNGSNVFATGAASVSLRGLGSAATLVLLNGRRIAPYGLGDPNAGQSGGAVNLNSIPLDVVERIEILKDGASAIYGSEAIAGVINIILRKDYKGGQFGATSTSNVEGYYRTDSLVATYGFGDLAKDRYNVFANVEAYRQQKVRLRDVDKFINREEFRFFNGTGVVLNTNSPFLTLNTDVRNRPVVPSAGAGCPRENVVPNPYLGFNITNTNAALGGTACLYDNVQFIDVVPKVKRDSAFVRGTMDVGAQTQIFAEASYVKNLINFRGAPRQVGANTGAVVDPSTNRVQPAPTVLPVGHPNNPFSTPVTFRGRMDAVGPLNTDVENETVRVVTGLKATLGKWDVEAGYLYNKNKVESISYNEIRYDRLLEAINGNGYNFANPSSGRITADQLRINTRDPADSSFQILDAKMSGELFTLPSGAAQIAVGLEYRKEDRFSGADPQKLIGNVFGRGISTASGSRNVSTIFSELVIPVASNVEAQIAGRYDRYSDFGNSFTPKLAIGWTPLTTLKFRGSFARGFRAPSLTEISRATTTGFFNNVDDPLRCNRTLGITAGCGIVIPAYIIANPNVQPEKTQSHTVGFVWEPSKDTNISVDYFSIARRDEIAFVGLGDVLINEGSTDPRFAGRVVRDRSDTSPDIPNDPGRILFVTSGFFNLGETRVRGLDFDARHRLSLGEYGRLALQLTATQYLELRSSSIEGLPLDSYNGYRQPRWRGNVRATWETGNWVNTFTANYVGRFKSFTNPETVSAASRAEIADCGNPNRTPYYATCSVKEWVTLDASTEYRGFRNVRLTFAARNLANERPPRDPLARPFNNTWYQPQGLNFTASVRYSFQ